MDTTWIVRLEAPGDGPRPAVKDCIDMVGLPTTAGCQVGTGGLPAMQKHSPPDSTTH